MPGVYVSHCVWLSCMVCSCARLPLTVDTLPFKVILWAWSYVGVVASGQLPTLLLWKISSGWKILRGKASTSLVFTLKFRKPDWIEVVSACVLNCNFFMQTDVLYEWVNFRLLFSHLQYENIESPLVFCGCLTKNHILLPPGFLTHNTATEEHDTVTQCRWLQVVKWSRLASQNIVPWIHVIYVSW